MVTRETSGDLFARAVDDLRVTAARVGAGGLFSRPDPADLAAARRLERDRTALLAKWRVAASDDEKIALARAALLSAYDAHKNPRAGEAPDWLADEVMEPAERWYRAAMIDVDGTLARAALRTGVAVVTPRFLALVNVYRRKRDEIAARWEQAEARGANGKDDRIAVARSATTFAMIVHEQLPGAPPAPAWLEQVDRKKAMPPKPAIRLTEEIESAARDAYESAKRGIDQLGTLGLETFALLALGGLAALVVFTRGRT
jgi:hypothetical protein